MLGLGARHGGIVKLSVVRCVTVFACFTYFTPSLVSAVPFITPFTHNRDLVNPTTHYCPIQGPARYLLCGLVAEAGRRYTYIVCTYLLRALASEKVTGDPPRGPEARRRQHKKCHVLVLRLPLLV